MLQSYYCTVGKKALIKVAYVSRIYYYKISGSYASTLVMVLVSLPLRKFSRPQCWYYPRKDINSYESGIDYSGIIYTQSFMNICRLVQKLLGGFDTQT